MRGKKEGLISRQFQESRKLLIGEISFPRGRSTLRLSKLKWWGTAFSFIYYGPPNSTPSPLVSLPFFLSSALVFYISRTSAASASILWSLVPGPLAHHHGLLNNQHPTRQYVAPRCWVPLWVDWLTFDSPQSSSTQSDMPAVTRWVASWPLPAAGTDDSSPV